MNSNPSRKKFRVIASVFFVSSCRNGENVVY